MKTRSLYLILCIAVLLATGCQAAAENKSVKFVERDSRIDVLIDGKQVTSYRYSDDLTKPVLYPVKTLSGVELNRGFPINPREGESKDHPHHLGIFFTYDEVNGTGYWNNTKSPPQIKHVKTVKAEGGDGKGTLETVMEWTDKEHKPVLEEKRTMVFHPGQDAYAIDITMDLTAKEKVEFGDTKEGMFAIRTADWFRENTGNTRYIASTGKTGAGEVWGTRAAWVALQGKKPEMDEAVGIAIMNHPTSVNYPTYWHARNYGLFSANPLGQYAFQTSKKVKNPEPLHLALDPGETAHFRFLVIIYQGEKTPEQLQQQFDKYAK